MRAYTSFSSARALVAFCLFEYLGVFASPSINVGLQAAFAPGPFLVELLETSAEENSTAYHPILDRIAEGHFAGKGSEKDLYIAFKELLRSDGHVTSPEALASFDFALSIRSAAPRVEAHYQYYRTSVEPLLPANQTSECNTWVAFHGKQYCSPELKEAFGDLEGERWYELPFDRLLGNRTSLASILYADITSSDFKKWHETLRGTAKKGKTSYRLRHKPPRNARNERLGVNGYGVALQLKRTDYIVIDDRQAESKEKIASQKPLGTKLDDNDAEIADLKPLSKDEVSDLALKAASFVMDSDQPLDTLVKLSQDFPKYSSIIAAHNTTDAFLKELKTNSDKMPPTGYNLLWVNGIQLPTRDIDPYSLLPHLRRERNLINDILSQGFLGSEVVSILSHDAVTEAQSRDEPQRYDFRDVAEGGEIIIWMNDVEKDSRYEEWPTELAALLQRTYPGQLPSVRRDIHNAVLPVDLTSEEDVRIVIDTVLNLIKRAIPLRWGIVPQTLNSQASLEQAKVVYYLQDSYGLSAAISYLQQSYENNKLATYDEAIFKSVVESAKLRKDRVALDISEILNNHRTVNRVDRAENYLIRLDAHGTNAPVFLNGVPIARNEEWLSSLSQRISMDLRTIQKGVFEGTINEEGWVPQQFLIQAASKRNSIIIPENDKDCTFVDMAKMEAALGDIFKAMPRVEADPESKTDWAHLTIIGDFDTIEGTSLMTGVARMRDSYPNVEVVIVHNPPLGNAWSGMSENIARAFPKHDRKASNDDLIAALTPDVSFKDTPPESKDLWEKGRPISEYLGLLPGQSGLLLNGRFVGPLPEGKLFVHEDVTTLVTYEQNRRITPLNKALNDLALLEKITSPMKIAKIQSLVAISTISDAPAGIFELPSTSRTNTFGKWTAKHTAIVEGDIDTAILQIVACIDPATEQAQKWIPILKALSDMDGTHLRLFFNPASKLQELPVKQFYRYLLNSKPTFTADGSLKSLKAEFSGIPKEALLNLGMDVPPSWLVAPEESLHDLDNIKLSSLADGANIDATYALESILIEGHSRDTSNGDQPPRGAEVVLSTEKDPHFADTIIMANLGYFQFKANPGLYNLQLKRGRSQEIFNLDSAGTIAWAEQPGDETTEIALMSFQGATIFPRLSRKPGQEQADVLVPDEILASDVVEKGSQKVNKLLSKIGINLESERLLAKGAELLAGKKAKRGTQADINIFSVASGHLYERMLNIMMVSVMKHTKHTVKFWFIEQFLSPSFKSFLPIMAKEYGFEFEMVTYKWPHWLRGQTEKQREIWGYKILFLDVLFPLDLDKVIFVDADQIVRTDMYELVIHNLEGAPYGFTPMGDSRTEMEGFRFWKTGYWASFLRGHPYHISALYVVDLNQFRQMAAGDRLRQQYQSLSADPNSLANLDQDLPNNMQFNLPIHSLPKEWLWCETWCSDADLAKAKTIDLCNNPQTKEPKLDRARRQIPEWTVYDDEIAALAKKVKGSNTSNVDIQEQEQIREKKVKDAERKHDEL